MVAVFCLIRLSRKNGLKVVYSLISLHGAILLCKVCWDFWTLLWPDTVEFWNCTLSPFKEEVLIKFEFSMIFIAQICINIFIDFYSEQYEVHFFSNWVILVKKICLGYKLLLFWKTSKIISSVWRSKHFFSGHITLPVLGLTHSMSSWQGFCSQCFLSGHSGS